jgi:hypothetical protein
LIETLAAPGEKTTWVTRRVPADVAITWKDVLAPTVGDLLLCEVVRTGIHGRVETTTGARSKIYPGDRIVCVPGPRYATSLLRATAEVGPEYADMISASGLCGRVVSRNRGVGTPTKLRVLAQGFVDGIPANVGAFSLGAPQMKTIDPRWVVVVGSAMDSGKTTACVSLIRHLVASGARVGAAKVTGTASSRDFRAFQDAGAVPVLDFLDAGWASTAGCSGPQLLEVVDTLTRHLRAASIDWGVIEIADGLLNPETRVLVQELPAVLGAFETVLTVRESLAALAGVEMLGGWGHQVVAVAGLVTNDPLSCREIELACSVACIPTGQLGRRLAAGGERPASSPISKTASGVPLV